MKKVIPLQLRRNLYNKNHQKYKTQQNNKIKKKKKINLKTKNL